MTSPFDLVVVTAANKAQARGYQTQLKGRVGFLVVPDPGDRRVGSLGATVNLLRKLKKLGSFSRVLVCHSGGDAKRTPAYAAQGKAFVPMPDGRPMLDHIIEEMAKYPAKDGVLVCCGDVIPYLDAARVRFAAEGVTGVAYPDGPWQAQRHGVYVADQDGVVTDFLQKPKVTRGRFLIDTGVMHIDWATAEKMTRLPVSGDIYEEFPKLLLNGFAKFSVAVVPTCQFFHIGSSRELLKFLGKKGRLVDSVVAPIQMLAGDNIVTNVPSSYGPISLKKGECLTSLPLGKDAWYHLRYHIDDTFKDDGLWDHHALGEKMRLVDHRRLAALRTSCARQNSGETIRVTRPLRLDLAGGWSDTPPICHERGGAVLNVAVTLEGRDPVVAEVTRLETPEVRVESVDLGKKGVLTTREEIYGKQDPHDWCALVKSALQVVGYEFEKGGLSIRISADVPKGSGMGTSSILGSALVEALLCALGRKVTPELVSLLTLELEQVMQTGGGWQDQMGALYPGVKLVESKPGKKQVCKVTRLSAAAEERFAQYVADHGVLYFTGQKRMARNVLRGVLAFYAENPYGIAHAIVESLKADARQAFKALESGDLQTFTAAVNRYWLNKKALDPGSTNPHVESIIARIAPWTDAVLLAGAGGGGFLFALAKDKAARESMLKVLDAAGGPGRSYHFSLSIPR